MYSPEWMCFSFLDGIAIDGRRVPPLGATPVTLAESLAQLQRQEAKQEAKPLAIVLCKVCIPQTFPQHIHEPSSI